MLSKFGNFFFKKIELWLVILILLIGTVFTVYLAYFAQERARGNYRSGTVGYVAWGVSQIPVVVKKTFLEALQIDKRYAHVDSEILEKLNRYNLNNNLSGYLTRYNSAEDKFELIKISDGTLFMSRKPQPGVKAISFFDNTVIVAAEEGPEQSAKILKKHDFNGEELWRVNINQHHGINIDSKGYIYTPIVMPPHEYLESLMPYNASYRDDGYAILDPNGNIVDQKSFTQILLDNNLGHLLLGVGPLERDGIHLNSVKAAEIKSDHWEPGDLLMSARHLSIVLLYRPSTEKIVWYQTGPWLNQHDPDFLNSSQISIFGNDMVSTFANRVSEDAKFIDKGNKIYIYDFDTNETSIRYRDIMNDIGLATVTAGSHHIFEDGSLFVNFSNTGVSIFYDIQTDTIEFFGHKHDENRLDRRFMTEFVPASVLVE